VTALVVAASLEDDEATIAPKNNQLELTYIYDKSEWKPIHPSGLRIADNAHNARCSEALLHITDAALRLFHRIATCFIPFGVVMVVALEQLEKAACGRTFVRIALEDFRRFSNFSEFDV
jgi:hypothetical protein